MQFTEQEMNKLPFQSFRKIAPLKARPLTEDDYMQRDGIIQSLEGPIGFQPGDYLARGIQGEEWPIQAGEFAAHYQQIAAPGADGFSFYRATDVRQALQIAESFTVRMKNGDVATGKAGDYLVRSGDSAWVVDRDIFESSYEKM
jgi:PGDYG protein